MRGRDVFEVAVEVDAEFFFAGLDVPVDEEDVGVEFGFGGGGLGGGAGLGHGFGGGGNDVVPDGGHGWICCVGLNSTNNITMW